MHKTAFMLQFLLYDGVLHGVSPQRGGEAKEASDRADDAGQSERPRCRRRQLRHRGTSSVPASVHVHQVPGKGLARQIALRTATARYGSSIRQPESAHR